MSNTNQFLANIILRGKIKVLTGLHIGGSKDKFEIGGVDNPVIRDPFTKYPYIPGSSLKGKMRMLLEFDLGLVEADKKGDYGPSIKEPIATLFGKSADDSKSEKSKKGPTRLIVRDSYPDAETIEMWKNLDSETLYAEYKAENTIDRLTSAANPRWLERVVKDSMFDFECILGVYSMDKDKYINGTDGLIPENYYSNIQTAIRLLEDSALGGGGSRGSGKVKFDLSERKIFPKDYYLTGTGEFDFNETNIINLFLNTN